MSTIRDNLKTLRITAGLSQNEAADALNVTRQTISSYETGRTEPDLETLKRLAELYHADINDVLYGGNRMQRRLRTIRRVMIALCAVFLLGLLLHSATRLLINTFFVVENGADLTEKIGEIARIRIGLWNTADYIARTGAGIFSVGILALMYPFLKCRKVVPFSRALMWICGLIAAVLVVTVPFALFDKVYARPDYLFPALYPLPAAALFVIVFVIVWICDLSGKKKNSKKTEPDI